MKDKKEREIMAVMTKPVNKAMITSEKNAEKMVKSADPALMERILKNAERINKQFVNKEK
ncbi:MAG: hypothetical protein NC253_02090 [Ruminococcus sp.]|nr:hypothetical protein [Ruminococcus sp.]MCM1382603.1 hypothetical protein [Muribaculaceae bacterium]MCM1481005.1 hypothetical protein [Muribaculaceae bacterium]